MDKQIIERAAEAAARARYEKSVAAGLVMAVDKDWSSMPQSVRNWYGNEEMPYVTAALAEVEASLTAEIRELRKESARLQADAWDACVAAATGGGLTQFAGMLRDENPFREDEQEDK